MRIFRPPLALTVGLLVVVAVTLGLAFWQWQRAGDKQRMEDAARKAMSATPVLLGAGGKNGAAAFRPYQRAVAVGRYLPQWEILIDNRIHRRRAGYHVITPLLLQNGSAVAVNRGWLAANAVHADLPAAPKPPPGQVTVHGVLSRDDSAAFQLKPPAAAGPVRQNLRLSQYAEYSGLPLLTLALVRQPATAGLAAVSLRVDFKSARSLSYAAQWLSFALLALVFYCVLAAKIGKPGAPGE